MVPGPYIFPGQLQGSGETDLCQQGEFCLSVGEVRLPHHVPGSDAEFFHLLEPPEGIQLPASRRRCPQGLPKILKEFATRPPMNQAGRVQEEIDDFGMLNQRAGEKVAHPEEPEKDAQGLGFLCQNGQKHPLGTHRCHQALKVIQRHVGIGGISQCLHQMRCHVRQCPPSSLAVMGKGGSVPQELKISIGPLEILKADLLQALPNFPRGHSAFEKEGDFVPFDCGRWGLPLTQESVVHAANGMRVRLVVSQEVFNRLGRDPSLVPRAAGQMKKLSLILRQGMSLTMVQDLEPVFDRPEKHIRFHQGCAILTREIAPLRQPVQGPEGVGLPDPGISPPMEELEDLNDELDLPDASKAPLHIPVEFPVLSEALLDPRLHGLDLLNRRLV